MAGRTHGVYVHSRGIKYSKNKYKELGNGKCCVDNWIGWRRWDSAWLLDRLSHRIPFWVGWHLGWNLNNEYSEMKGVFSEGDC